MVETDREGEWNGKKRCVSVSCLQTLCSPLPGFSHFITLLQLGTLYQPKMFDILGVRLNNELSLWCIKEQLGQIPLILPLTLIVFD